MLRSTLVTPSTGVGGSNVAIHAPLAGGDNRCRRTSASCDPRPPRGRRHDPGRIRDPQVGCDPRPPRGRRRCGQSRSSIRWTPPSREATPDTDADEFSGDVAIHAPLAGGDIAACPVCGHPGELRSTPPSREATRRGGVNMAPKYVAIHAPLAGGDLAKRPEATASAVLRSTPPSREATSAPIRHAARNWSCDPRPPRGRRRWLRWGGCG